eukprot:scaffold101_cov230-Pinguiococcus_pyrenoidosus.AAC.10
MPPLLLAPAGGMCELCVLTPVHLLVHVEDLAELPAAIHSADEGEEACAGAAVAVVQAARLGARPNQHGVDQGKDRDLRPVLHQDVRVPPVAVEDLAQGAILLPVHEEADGADDLHRGPHEEEEVADDGEDENPGDLVLVADLVDVHHRHQDLADAVAELAELEDADHGAASEEHGIHEDHPLGGVQPAQEAGDVDAFDEHEAAHDADEAVHGLLAIHGLVVQALEKIRPHDDEQDEKREERHAARTQQQLAEQRADPVAGESMHRSWRVARLQGVAGHEEPDRSRHGACGVKHVKVRDHGQVPSHKAEAADKLLEAKEAQDEEAQPEGQVVAELAGRFHHSVDINRSAKRASMVEQRQRGGSARDLRCLRAQHRLPRSLWRGHGRPMVARRRAARRILARLSQLQNWRETT